MISVIVPVFNTKKYLSKCVQSILDQTFNDIEIVLVDDGSTDGSSELCDRFAEEQKNITVVHKNNGGLSSARNAGIKASKGDYIGFVDSDDFINPSMYKRLFDVINGRPGVIGNVNYTRVTESGEIIRAKCPHDSPDLTSKIDYYRELLLHTGDSSVCTKLFPASLFTMFQFDETRLNEDVLFMFQISEQFSEIAYTGTIEYNYLIRAGSLSNGYGKAVEDMVLNSSEINEIVGCRYPVLMDEANRFKLFQNMAFLLLVPKEKRSLSLYSESIHYLRCYFFKNGFLNRYLRIKEKIIILGLICIPQLVGKLYQEKHRG